MLYHISKRITDIAMSALILAAVFPFVSLYSLIILVFWKVNPFFIQERALGSSGGSFSIVKIRTLKPSAYIHKIRDTRLVSSSDFLPLGQLLRRTGFDELPQLFLVISGKMSIIGPRPLMLDDIAFIEEKYPGLMRQRGKMKCLPGISGLWQLKRSSAVSYDQLYLFDAEYVSRRNIFFDWKLMGLTTVKMLLGYHTDALQSLSDSEEKTELVR